LNVVVVQPNIDPYVNFSSDFREQLEVMLKLAESKIDSTTDYVVMPETALVEDIWEHQLDFSTSIRMLRDFRKKYPRLKIVTGASTAKIYEDGNNLSATARKFKNMPGWFDSYNTALQVDSLAEVQIYHKSKLVPGVEKMPFPAIMKPLESFAINLGGTSGSLGMQDEREIFIAPKNGQGKIAPVICYESIYGDYVGDYIRKGADFIFIITNDGWWGNTPGYRQHLRYGRLRAIETRKSIARSANTGISCFINQRGDIEQATSWWVATSIKQRIYSTQGETFYTRYGDYLAWFMLMLWGTTLIFVLAKRMGW
ncbi:MAG: apolipoprotein N-acyltransferase, partial [Bacteroidia bacterium]